MNWKIRPRFFIFFLATLFFMGACVMPGAVTTASEPDPEPVRKHYQDVDGDWMPEIGECFLNRGGMWYCNAYELTVPAPEIRNKIIGFDFHADTIIDVWFFFSFNEETEKYSVSQFLGSGDGTIKEGERHADYNCKRYGWNKEEVRKIHKGPYIFMQNGIDGDFTVTGRSGPKIAPPEDNINESNPDRFKRRDAAGKGDNFNERGNITDNGGSGGIRGSVKSS